MWPKVVERLSRGEAVEVRPTGNSMTPIINSRQLVRIVPVKPTSFERGDVVLAKVAGRFYLHLVSAVQGDRVQISNNHGHVNGWTSRDRVYGIVQSVDGVSIRRSSRNKERSEDPR
jgi:hypothetical protein